jgi:serine protease Do
MRGFGVATIRSKARIVLAGGLVAVVAAALTLWSNQPGAPRMASASVALDGRFGHAGDVSLDRLAELEAAFTALTERVAPAVVGIRVERVIPTHAVETTADVDQYVVVNGSGCIVRSDGYILTNEHVVQNARSIQVNFHDGQQRTARLTASDPRSDLAIIHVDRAGLQSVRWADWQTVRRGIWTIAVGNPYGLGNDGNACVSTGVLSNLGRRLPGLGREDDRNYVDMLQTTAAINPGHSGGPLFNIRGEVIGIVAAVYVRAGSDGGVGFAIPMTTERVALVEDLLAGREIEYGYLGLAVRDLATDDPQPTSRGPLVTSVEAGGPGARAGIQVGDIVATLNGEPVGDALSFAYRVGRQPVGQPVAVTVQRDGRRLDLTATVGRRDLLRVGWLRGGALLWRGIKFGEIAQEKVVTFEDAQPRGILVVEVRPGTDAAQAGLASGDVVTAVDGRPVSGLAQFHLTVRGQRKALPLTLRQGGVVTIAP